MIVPIQRQLSRPPWKVQLIIRDGLLVPGIPNEVVDGVAQQCRCLTSGLPECDESNVVGSTKYFVHQRANDVHVFITDLHENRSRLRHQLPTQVQTLLQVRQIRVDAQRPRVTERLDRQHVVGRLFLVVLRRVHPLLKVRVVLDAVRRVDVDHLHPAAEPLVVEQGFHDVERVATDELVLPALVVGVELDAPLAVVVAQFTLQVGEQLLLASGVLLLRRRQAGPFDDPGDARLGDDLVALERKQGDVAAVALTGPEEHGVSGGVHVDHDGRIAVLGRGEAPDVDRAAPAVVHRERHDLLVARQQRGVAGLGCPWLLHLGVGVASDGLVGLGLALGHQLVLGVAAGAASRPAVHMPR